MKTNNSKKRFVLSLVVTVVSIAMLVGATFAWFTDSVTSGKNKIVAGNLDVELEYLDGDGQWNSVTEDTKLFNDEALWEPGYTEVAYLRLSNKGNLALKYNLSVNVDNEVEGTNVDGQAFKLSDYINMGVVENWNGTVYIDRAAARAAVNEAGKITTYKKLGNMEKDAAPVYMSIVVYMPETVGNEANPKTGTTPPSIELGVSVVATQLSNESDSFDNKYDIVAPWVGEVADKVPYDEETQTYTVSTGAELAKIAQMVNEGNSLADETVILAKDIDLNNVPWTPIGIGNSKTPPYFSGTFDGKGHTIINLNVSGDKNVGLFGDVYGGTVENLKVNGATVKGINAVGAVCGLAYYANINNCSVKNATVTSSVKNNDDGDKVGGVVGRLSVEEGNGSVTNCSVENVTVQGLRQVGGVLGGAYKTSGSYDVSGNSAKNSTIICDMSTTYPGHTTEYEDVREVIGTPEALNSASTKEGVNIVVKYADGLVKENDIYKISTATGLKAFAKLVTNTPDPGYPSQKTINAEVSDDLNAKGVEWNNVVLEPKARVSVHIDGKNHSISNVNVKGEGNVALFAAAGSDKNSGGLMTIKDFTIKDSSFVSTKYIGGAQGTAAFIGNLSGECSMTNCHVKNCTLQTAKYAGGFIGYDAHGSSTPVFTDCTIDGIILKSTATSGSTSMGGFVGYTESSHIIKGLDVKNVTNNGASGATVYYGLYYGTPNTTITLSRCKQSENLAGRKEENMHIIVE